jgi:hypothetical protein
VAHHPGKAEEPMEAGLTAYYVLGFALGYLLVEALQWKQG